MEQTWRWFGPDDLVRLPHIRQAGATGIVTALHHIPYGVVWTIDQIEKRKALIAADQSLGLRWSVVESLPIHERIKLGEGDLTQLFENYRQSMRNLAACGIEVICYNFMPILDWTRTDLAFPLPGGGTCLALRRGEVLRVRLLHGRAPRRGGRPRAGAGRQGPPMVRQHRPRATRRSCWPTSMAGLPGAYDRYDIPDLRAMLARYHGIDRDALRANYARFLREVIPTAEEVGIRMCVHPDDPPRPLFGLPAHRLRRR